MVTPVFAPQNKNPKYPFLPSSEPGALGEYLSARNFLFSGEHITRVCAVSARSRNTILRITTNERSLVLKSFRDWSANGCETPSIRDRFNAECQFHDSVRVSEKLGSLLPNQLHCDARAGCVVFEDAGVRPTRSPVLTPADAGGLAWFLASMHHHSQSLPERARYRSKEVVEWQTQRLFGRFFKSSRTIVRNPVEKLIVSNRVVAQAIREARDALLTEGTSLVHGDFLPWNWAGSTGKLKVVDAECSFFGCPEFDAGAFLAGLLLSKQSDAVLNEAVYVLTDGCVRYDVRLVAAFAATHMCALLSETTVDKSLACGVQAITGLQRAVAAVKDGTLGPFVRRTG